MELQMETDIITPEIDTNVNSGTTNANVAGSISSINLSHVESGQSNNPNSIVSKVYGLSINKRLRSRLDMRFLKFLERMTSKARFTDLEFVLFLIRSKRSITLVLREWDKRDFYLRLEDFRILEKSFDLKLLEKERDEGRLMGIMQRLRLIPFVWSTMKDTTRIPQEVADECINAVQRLGLEHIRTFDDIKEWMKVWGKNELDLDLERFFTEDAGGNKILNRFFGDFEKRRLHFFLEWQMQCGAWDFEAALRLLKCSGWSEEKWQDLRIKCKECHKYYSISTSKWCMKCNLKHLKHDFKKWSGNKRIDDLIQRIQTIANGPEKVMEWIPYENFKEVKYINRGGFATVYSADWSDGPIEKWDVKLKQWSRRKNEPVALKYVDNSKAEIDYFLKEVESYFEITDNSAFIRCLGISQHPDGRYIIVLEFAVLGSLRSYLDENHKHMTWKEKITALFNISMGLNTLHKSQLIHHDFHSGNLLFLRDVGGKFLNISDLGQCKRDGQNELSAVIGILPYIGPEVLHEKKYTKASDIYSFGIVAYEIITGFRPHADLNHDHHLAIEIMNGLRPKIPKSTPKLLAKLIMQCWDARPNKRPTSNELYLTIKRLYDEVMENKPTEFVEQIKKAEKAEENSTDSPQINASKMPHYKTHPGAIYTSRLLDFSTLPPPVNAPDFEVSLKISSETENLHDSKIVNLDLSALEDTELQDFEG